MRATAYVPSMPVTYEPCIVLVARGRKIGRLGEHTFVYDPDHYLVLDARRLPEELAAEVRARVQPLLAQAVRTAVP